MEWIDHPLLEALSVSARCSNFTPQGLSNMAWAFAQIAVRDVPFLCEIATACVDKMAEFSSQALSNTAWAFATLWCRDVPLLTAIEYHVEGTDFQPQELSNLVWAFAMLQISTPPVEHALVLDFSAQQLANTIWAFAESEVSVEPMIGRIDQLAAGACLDDIRALAAINGAIAGVEGSTTAVFLPDRQLETPELLGPSLMACEQSLSHPERSSRAWKI